MFRGWPKMLNTYSPSPLTKIMIIDEVTHRFIAKRKQLHIRGVRADTNNDHATAEYYFYKVKLFTQVIGFLRGLESDILNGTEEKGA